MYPQRRSRDSTSRASTGSTSAVTTWWLPSRSDRSGLDTENPVPPDAARLLRVLKIGEESGEAAEAVH